MDARRLNLGGLFELSIRLKAPLFQRPYVWKRDSNWEPLWESIVDIATRRLDQKPDRPHFLGAIVFEQLPVPTGQIGDVRQIIDGQQRLTTLQVALAAARDLARAQSQTFFADDLALLTENHTTNPSERFKVEPTTVDVEPFAFVMSAGSPAGLREKFGAEAEAKEIGHLLADCYLFFHESISDWLRNGDGGLADGKRWEVFSVAVRSGLQLVVIDLDPGKDDAQEIFETLNYGGVPLLPADLIKNYLFRKLELEGAAAAPQHIYDKYWRRFDLDGSFWRDEVRQGRLKTPRVNIFLQNYLTLRTADDVPSTNIFGIFREQARAIPAVSSFESLADYADVFERFTKAGKGTREQQFLDRLEQLDVSTFQPLFLEIFRPQAGLSRQDFLEILQDIESFLVRRVVCNVTTKGYNRLVVDLIADLRAQGSFSAAAIREFLLKQTAESSFWPTDDDFVTAWRDERVYWFKKSKVRMILEAMDTHQQDAKAEDVKYADYREKLTIEHLLPQNWREHWPLPAGVPADEAAERRERALHTFGNLTLLNGKLNPAVSNGPWSAKIAAIWEHSKLNLNRELRKRSTWDEAGIRERADSLFRTALELWPRPADPRATQRPRASRPEAGAAGVGLRPPRPTPAERKRLDEVAFFHVLSSTAGSEAADLARRIAAAVREGGVSFRPRRGLAVIRVRLEDRHRRIVVCHISTDSAIRFGWTKGQLEDLDLPSQLLKDFYGRVASAFALRVKSNGAPTGLTLGRIAEDPVAFISAVIEFSNSVKTAAGQRAVAAADEAVDGAEEDEDEIDIEEEEQQD